MGLKDLFKRGDKMLDPVRGTAQVITASMHNGRGIYQSCHMELVVQAEGVPAAAVQVDQLVHSKRWPLPGMVLPVTVDRADRTKFTIEWDEIPSTRERGHQTAEAMAALLRGEVVPDDASSGPIGTTVVNLTGDVSQLTEEQKAKLRMLGLDLDALAAAQGAGAGGTGMPPPPVGPETEVDERVDLLERLAKLKEQGLLTDAEFDAQKRQILEG